MPILLIGEGYDVFFHRWIKWCSNLNCTWAKRLNSHPSDWKAKCSRQGYRCLKKQANQTNLTKFLLAISILVTALCKLVKNLAVLKNIREFLPKMQRFCRIAPSRLKTTTVILLHVLSIIYLFRGLIVFYTEEDGLLERFNTVNSAFYKITDQR